MNESSNEILLDRECANEATQAKDGDGRVRYVRCRTGLSCKPYRIPLVLALAGLCCAWTCSAVVNLRPCPDAIPYAEIGELSPNPISADTGPVVLTVEGSGFLPQSEILWNQNPLATTFLDSRHLQTTITQETFKAYGGSAGRDVEITVTSPGSSDLVECTNGGNSSTLFLEID